MWDWDFIGGSGKTANRKADKCIKLRKKKKEKRKINIRISIMQEIKIGWLGHYFWVSSSQKGSKGVILSERKRKKNLIMKRSEKKLST